MFDGVLSVGDERYWFDRCVPVTRSLEDEDDRGPAASSNVLLDLAVPVRLWDCLAVMVCCASDSVDVGVLEIGSDFGALSEAGV